MEDKRKRKLHTIRKIESEKRDLSEINELNPYPNPSNGIFFVDVQEDYTVQQIEILNSIGEIIEYCSPIISGKNELDLRNFQSGVYYIRIISEESVKIFKLIKE